MTRTQYHREWRARNRERLRAYERARAKDPKTKAIRRQSSRRWIAKHPERRQANIDLNNALKLGSITKPDRCTECSAKARVEAHHEDYSKPLEVRWLCKFCHEAIHHEEQNNG